MVTILHNGITELSPVQTSMGWGPYQYGLDFQVYGQQTGIPIADPTQEVSAMDYCVTSPVDCFRTIASVAAIPAAVGTGALAHPIKT